MRARPATNEAARRFYEAGGWHPDGTTRTEDFDGEPVEELRYRRRSTIAE
ncbi:hypothetical protein Dvina_25355 [Dactylosporangium vinaceum]|uniref:N-acetyltransferase domain-containing protein n=1 Tax=Dactylosporangium vinaceum TaxID=53362 RepID=A0ABV5MDQ8_9ACTN|nr:hypothetical protein [Dactylosporangium vinaceum]UAC01086.1 hypothetical protein Dvina_25355 [Dactylosporangium vinaceum]